MSFNKYNYNISLIVNTPKIYNTPKAVFCQDEALAHIYLNYKYMGVIFLFLSIISGILSTLVYIALHPTNAGSFPMPLSAKDEIELIEKMQKGDNNARSKLIEHNLRLVAHVAKKYMGPGIDSDDLISIGTIGLIKAVSSFNTEKGIRLATYAARCIDNEILMHFRSTKKNSNDVSINEPIDTDRDGNDLTLIDVIADDKNIVDEIDTKIKIDKLHKYIDSALTGRERMIIKLRYGLIGGKEYTQREVAKQLKISRSYVSRIEKKALSKLYDKFVSKNG